MDWQSLNDGDSTTMGYASPSPNAYMELDFGVGGVETTCVRVIHSTWVRTRLNGIMLSIMDNARTVLYQYTWSNVVNSSPMIDNFNLSQQGGMQHVGVVGDLSLWIGFPFGWDPTGSPACRPSG